MSQTQQFFVTVATGLESILKPEIEAMGISEIKVVGSGLYFNGSLEQAYRVCLWSRVANRVLLPLAEFPAASAEALYEQIREVDWSQQMDVNSTLAVDFFTARSTITHSQYGALKVKDAIVDQFREATGIRPSVDRQKPSIRINLYLYRNKARLALDLAGMSLHRRGYRDEATMAPLKENLAAALLYAMGWPALAAEGRSFCDPLCGSGTFLIEAAMMAADIAPQAQRDYFGFLGWKGHQSELWNALRSEAMQRGKQGLAVLKNQIYGSDRSTGVISQATQNVALAGLQSVVNVKIGNIEQIQYPRDMPVGLVLCNPPYGVRMQHSSDIGKLYSTLGRVFKRQFGGWRLGVITANPDLMHRIRLRTEQRLDCANGGIACKLIQAEIPLQSSVEQTTGRHCETKVSPWQQSSRLSLPTKHRHAEMFANRLRKNFKLIEKWAKAEGIGCYRVYDADLPEYALAIDVYESARRYVHIQEYRAPASVDKKVAAQRLQAAVAEIPAVLACDPDAISIKERRRQSGLQQYEKLQKRKETFVIEEHGCRFEVNLFDYLDSGIFADSRKIRRWIYKRARGKRFLNLFAYTGTATVCAAIGGASTTTTIDMSSNYLDWAKRNLALNLDYSTNHQFIRADCLAWLDSPPENLEYDLILLDPPTFSNSNRMDTDWDVQRDHVRIIRQTLRLLSQDGLLIFSNNFRKFKLDRKQLDRYEVTDESRASIARDFARKPKIHQCFFISKAKPG